MTRMKKCYDVAVVGSGIAGACAAVALARRGIEVVLLEAGEFPRHKVCGEFLSPESSAIFERLGLLTDIRRAGARPVQQTHIVVHGKTLGATLPGVGLSLSRYQLDLTLWNGALAAGVQGLTHARVHSAQQRDEALWCLVTDRGEFEVHNLIVASGRHSSWLAHQASPPLGHSGRPSGRSRRWRNTLYFGMKAHFAGAGLEEGVVELYPFRGGYCGLVRVENDLTNVCLLARYDTLCKRAPHVFWAQIIRDNPALARRLAGASPTMDWLTTGNLTFAHAQPAVNDALCCGDAAGFIAPLAGDGMAMAARSGELAAAVAAARTRGTLNLGEAAQLYTAAWQREFGKRLLWAGALQSLLTTPSLTISGFALVSRLPLLARLAVANTRTV